VVVDGLSPSILHVLLMADFEVFVLERASAVTATAERMKPSYCIWQIQFLQEEVISRSRHCDSFYPGVLSHGAKCESFAIYGWEAAHSGE